MPFSFEAMPIRSRSPSSVVDTLGERPSQLRQVSEICTERGELEMAQLVSKALQNKLRSNLAPPKGIFSQDKILGDEPSGVAALASVCRDGLSAILP